MQKIHGISGVMHWGDGQFECLIIDFKWFGIWYELCKTKIDRTKNKGKIMLAWTVIFLIIALIAGLLGFSGIAGAAVGIARVLFVIFLVLFLVTLIARLA
jgi:uncharacterized membrane protein YtjA (UPF0391 family)